MLSIAAVVCLACLAPMMPPGFTQETYAEVCDVANIALAPDGVLFAGNNGCGVGPGDPAWVRRVGVGGMPVEDYGSAAIPDPDTVAYDADGAISGTPGSVIVGGLIAGGLGRLTAILPNETNVDLFGPVALANALQLIPDGARMLSIDYGSAGVYEITAGGVELLIPGTGEGTRAGLAVGPDGAIYVSRSDGRIEKFDGDGVLIDNAFYEGEAALSAFLAFGPGNEFGDALYARNADGETLAIDATGDATVFGTDVSAGFAAFGPDGALYIGNSAEDTVYRVVAVCAADCNGDGNLNILDFVCFQGEWQAQTGSGDCDGNGAFNILDFVCFQGLFVAGCG